VPHVAGPAGRRPRHEATAAPTGPANGVATPRPCPALAFQFIPSWGIPGANIFPALRVVSISGPRSRRPAWSVLGWLPPECRGAGYSRVSPRWLGQAPRQSGQGFLSEQVSRSVRRFRARSAALSAALRGRQCVSSGFSGGVRVHPGRLTEGPPDRRREPLGKRWSPDTALRVRLPLLPLKKGMRDEG